METDGGFVCLFHFCVCVFLFFSPSESALWINLRWTSEQTLSISPPDAHRLNLHKHPCSHPSSHKLTGNTQPLNRKAGPAQLPKGLEEGAICFPSIPILQNPFRLHLTEFISHLRIFKCLKNLSWRLSRLSGRLLSGSSVERATCQGFRCVSTELLSAARHITGCSGSLQWLPISQQHKHTRNLLLYLPTSLRSGWKAGQRRHQ